jgi:hypothetical protein
MDVPLSDIAEAAVDTPDARDQRVSNTGRQDVVSGSRGRGWNLESVGDPQLGISSNTDQDASRLVGMRAACRSEDAALGQLGN